VLGTPTVSADDNAITVTTLSDSEIMSTKNTIIFATTLSSTTIYITTAVGGVLFFLTVMVVLLGVTAGLLVRRVKHNVKTKQLQDVSPKQTPSGISTL
jgi:uncharacterized membrane protein YfcA